jgi:DNA-binding IscR family transcriptional regulator
MKPSVALATSLRVVHYIAEQGEGAIVPIADLETVLFKPHRYLDNVAVDLRDLEILRSHRGAKGGYELITPPHLLTYFEPVSLIYGSLGLSACAMADDAPLCAGCNEDCPVRAVLNRARRAATAELLRSTFGAPPGR